MGRCGTRTTCLLFQLAVQLLKQSSLRCSAFSTMPRSPLSAGQQVYNSLFMHRRSFELAASGTPHLILLFPSHKMNQSLLYAFCTILWQQKRPFPTKHSHRNPQKFQNAEWFILWQFQKKIVHCENFVSVRFLLRIQIVTS